MTKKHKPQPVQPNSIIEKLELSVRANNLLRTMGILTVGQLLGYTKARLLVTRGFGPKTLAEVEEALKKQGGYNLTNY